MFHFPALPPAALCIQAGATPHNGCQVSPFGNPRITVWLPTPRGISQAPASFIGSWCQGIHRVPLKTWHNKITHCFIRRNRRCSRPLCSSQETDSNPGHHPKTAAAACKRKHPFPQDPTACPAPSPRRPRSADPANGARVLDRRQPERQPNSRCSTRKQWTPGQTIAGRRRRVLLRKEVIQPHLPVRLPCYDFVPIADPTFDSSLPYGLGRRLRVLPTFVT